MLGMYIKPRYLYMNLKLELLLVTLTGLSVLLPMCDVEPEEVSQTPTDPSVLEFVDEGT